MSLEKLHNKVRTNEAEKLAHIEQIRSRESDVHNLEASVQGLKGAYDK